MWLENKVERKLENNWPQGVKNDSHHIHWVDMNAEREERFQAVLGYTVKANTFCFEHTYLGWPMGRGGEKQ